MRWKSRALYAEDELRTSGWRGSCWVGIALVKLEVLGESQDALYRHAGTFAAAEQLVKEKFRLMGIAWTIPRLQATGRDWLRRGHAAGSGSGFNGADPKRSPNMPMLMDLSKSVEADSLGSRPGGGGVGDLTPPRWRADRFAHTLGDRQCIPGLRAGQ